MRRSRWFIAMVLATIPATVLSSAVPAPGMDDSQSNGRWQKVKSLVSDLAGRAMRSPYLEVIPRIERLHAIQAIMDRRQQDAAVIQSAVKCGYLTRSDQVRFNAAYAELALYPTISAADNGKLFEHWLSSAKSLTALEVGLFRKAIAAKSGQHCSDADYTPPLTGGVSDPSGMGSDNGVEVNLSGIM